MATNVRITYVNQSGNQECPKVFVFTKNLIPSFDVLVDGVAWKVMSDIGRGSSCHFTYPIHTAVQAMWGDSSQTRSLTAEIGKRYTVMKNNTGIVLMANGNASQTTAIEINNDIQVEGGIQAQLSKDDKVLMTKHNVAYNQKATFVLHPKLYWGVASEIQQGDFLSSAVLNTDHFFEQDIQGVNQSVVTLKGNARDGYQFDVTNKV